MPQSNLRQLQEQQLQFQTKQLQSQLMLDAQKKFYFEHQKAPFFNPQQIYNIKKSKHDNQETKKHLSIDTENFYENLKYCKTKYRKQNKKLFLCFDEFGNIEFSPQFMRRFHWISQVKKSFKNIKNFFR